MIEVRVSGKGTVRGDEVTKDAATQAQCGLCNTAVDAVASVGGELACKTCLRMRLEAMTLGTYQLDAPGKLPWGAVTS